jgi:hypothetical protein
MEEQTTKKKGRPAGKKSASTKMLRVIITPRQERIFDQIRREIGGTESEHVRRALDDYIDQRQLLFPFNDNYNSRFIASRKILLSGF